MPKIVDHDQYRKELLDKCFNLFAEKGYGAVTMRQIAQELGVSTGTLYHYFSSKEVLFEQLLDDVSEQEMVQVTAEIQKAKTIGDRIEIGLQCLEQDRDYHEKLALLAVDFYQQQQRDGGETDALRRLRTEVKSWIRELIGIQDEDVINLLFCHVDGLMYHRIYGGEPISITRQAKVLAQMIMAYMALKQVQTQEER